MLASIKLIESYQKSLDRVNSIESGPCACGEQANPATILDLEKRWYLCRLKKKKKSLIGWKCFKGYGFLLALNGILNMTTK